MNMFKYLLLSVVCVAVVGLKAEEAVVIKAQEPVVVEQPQAQDADFTEWAKSLEMTDEEKAQFVAEMNTDIDQDRDAPVVDTKKAVDKDLSVNEKPILEALQEEGAHEAKVVPLEVELPEVAK
jgi:hypothetical protein